MDSKPHSVNELQKSSLFYYSIDNNFMLNSQQILKSQAQTNYDLSILIQQQLLQQQLQQNMNNSNISQLYYHDNLSQSYNHDGDYYHDSFSQKVNTDKQFETKTEIQSNTHKEKKRNNKIENNKHWKKSKINDQVDCRYCGKNMFTTICFLPCKFYFIHTIAANLKKVTYVKDCKYKDNCHKFHTTIFVVGQIIYINIRGHIIDKFICEILTFNEKKCTLRVNVIGELKIGDRNYITFYKDSEFERTVDIFKTNWDFCSYDNKNLIF